MKKVIVREFGPPEVLEVVEAPEPEPGPDDVVVDIKAAHVLWVETAVRGGRGKDWFPLRPPYTPGTGIAGVEAGTGRRVVAHTGSGDGYAERAAVPRGQVVALPDEVSFEEAAALVHDATTALALFDALEVGADDSVLVIGASGGLGLVSLQLAGLRAKGVIALARNPLKIARIEAAGFHVVDTEQDGWVDRVRREFPQGAEVVLDNIGGAIAQAAITLLADGGRWSAHGTAGGNFTSISAEHLSQHGQRMVELSAAQLPLERRMRLIAQGLGLAASGDLQMVVGQTFPLGRAADAHRAIEDRTAFGATILIP